MTFPFKSDDFARTAREVFGHIAAVQSRSTERARKKDAFLSLNNWTYRSALVITGLTTFLGLVGIFRDANPAGGLTALLFAGAVSTILYLGQAWALALWRSYRPWRALGIPFYLLFALPSVAFAFAFWWAMLNARDHTVREARSTVATVLRTADTVDAALSTLIRTTDNLATYSKSQSDLETANGGTCGDGSHGTKGPRAILRSQDTQSLGAASSYMKEVAAPADQAISALRQDLAPILSRDFGAKAAPQREASIAELNQRIDSVGRLVDAASHDQRLLAYRGEFQDRLAKENAPIIVNGATFTCHDATLRSSLTGAIAAINALATAPALSGLHVEFNEGGKANLFALNRLQNTFAGGSPVTDHAAIVAARRLVAQGGEAATQASADPSSEAGTLEGRDWGVLFVAIFFDLLIAGAGFSKGRDPARQLSAAARMAEEHPDDPVSQILADLKRNGSALAATAGPYAVAYDGDDYLIVPVRPSDERPPVGYEQTPFLVQNIAALLAAAGLAKAFSPIPPLRRELLTRLDLALGLGAFASSDRQKEASGPDRQPTSQAWRRILKSFVAATAPLIDKEHEARKRNYGFYRVQPGSLRDLRLRRPPAVEA